MTEKTPPAPAPETDKKGDAPAKAPPAREIGGRDGLDPVRYGDWEKGGIAVDF